MTSEETPKVKPVKYNLGKGDYLMTVPTANGYYVWGYVSGNHIQFEDKDLKVIGGKIVNYLANANIDFLAKAARSKEVMPQIKKSWLEKTIKDLGEEK
jgi:hypothetical protein